MPRSRAPLRRSLAATAYTAPPTPRRTRRRAAVAGRCGRSPRRIGPRPHPRPVPDLPFQSPWLTPPPNDDVRRTERTLGVGRFARGHLAQRLGRPARGLFLDDV